LKLKNDEKKNEIMLQRSENILTITNYIEELDMLREKSR
jgi:hypothetical protein